MNLNIKNAKNGNSFISISIKNEEDIASSSSFSCFSKNVRVSTLSSVCIFLFFFAVYLLRFDREIL
jgi:hypothetical protein